MKKQFDDDLDDMGCFVWAGAGLLCLIALILYLSL